MKTREVDIVKTKKESTGEDEKDLYIKQDDENILLEQPALIEEQKAPDLSLLESQDLTNEDKIVIQAYINYCFISLPQKDEQTFEVIRPYINVCVTKSTNWLTFSKALMYRSRNEIQRHKMMERSLA